MHEDVASRGKGKGVGDPSGSTCVWDESESPDVQALVKRFTSDWESWRDHRESSRGEVLSPRPDPADYLPLGLGLAAHGQSAAVFAVLRADLGLRRADGERVRLEEYQDRWPEVERDVLVGLIYEEICLREDEGERPSQAEYTQRFPEVAEALGKVLEIHSLVGKTCPTPSFLEGLSGEPRHPWPVVGETVAGYRLEEELGRGTFARVFLARESDLGDRHVALKVARFGGREPVTLARLQHTHIMSVYSSKVDQATGFRLMCMPFHGRVTLAQLLDDPEIRCLGTGDALLRVIDGLSQRQSGHSTQTQENEADRSPVGGRRELAKRDFNRAIAWWGARLAEALAHAHERGVLHRDIKPSNVLITTDAMPMLLDFNLADDDSDTLEIRESNAVAVGGTIAYMAPEHLEALAEGQGGMITERSDIYAFGVLLFELLTGRRPFSSLDAGTNLAQSLHALARRRRREFATLRATETVIPAALRAILRGCLEPEPIQRYATARELATDLQAFADGRPLRHAREPLASRAMRWTIANRRGLAVAVPAILAVLWLTESARQSELRKAVLVARVTEAVTNAQRAELKEDFNDARQGYAVARQLAEGARSQRALELGQLAFDRLRKLDERQQVVQAAHALLTSANMIRFDLLGFAGNPEQGSLQLQRLLEPLGVFQSRDWTSHPRLRLLDDSIRDRLIEEVDEITFIWSIALARSKKPEILAAARTLADRSASIAQIPEPWLALRDILDGDEARSRSTFDPDMEVQAARGMLSPVACFQWGLLNQFLGRFDPALIWLERAERLRPRHYWYQYFLAAHYLRVNLGHEAYAHFTAAIALMPESPWAYLGRSAVLRDEENWDLALADLDRAVKASGGTLPTARFSRAIVRLTTADLDGARADLQSLVNSSRDRLDALEVRQYLADLAEIEGSYEEARSLRQELTREPVARLNAELGLARLDSRLGNYREALDRLTKLLSQSSGTPPREPGLPEVRPLSPVTRAELLAIRAQYFMRVGEARQALQDALDAERLAASPENARLRQFAAARAGDWETADISSLSPVMTWSRADLLACEKDLLAARDRSPGSIRIERALAVVQGALGTPQALKQARDLVQLSVGSDEPDDQALLIQAQTLIRLARLREARQVLEEGERLSPLSPEWSELLGEIELRENRLDAALRALDQAIRRGADASAHATRAEVYERLGQSTESVKEWSIALRNDPTHLGYRYRRAWFWIRMRRWDQALADLERIATQAMSMERCDWLARIIPGYLACVPDRGKTWARLRALTLHLARADQSRPRKEVRRRLEPLKDQN